MLAADIKQAHVGRRITRGKGSMILRVFEHFNDSVVVCGYGPNKDGLVCFDIPHNEEVNIE